MVLVVVVFTVSTQGALVPTDLRCEYLNNPHGIDDLHPCLSWKIEAKETDPQSVRGVMQSAYRILAASSPEKLVRGDGDLWDSGKVASEQSLDVEYAGKSLTTRERCHWKVQVWDGTGTVSGWSEPAQWDMGFLNAEDWRARWITAAARNDGTLKDQFGGGQQTPQAAPPQILPLLRAAFRVEKPVRRAEIAICGLGFYEARLNGTPLDDAVLEPGWTNYRKTCLYRVHDLSGRIVPGENVLGVMLGNGMYNVPGGRYTKFTASFGPPKLIAQLDIEYADGTTACVVTDGDWKTAPGPITFSCIYGGEDHDARRECAGWDRPGFDAANWQVAQECAGPGGRLSALSAPPIKVMETLDTAKVKQPKPGLWVYDLGQNFSGWPRLSVRGPAGATVKMITGELLDKNGLVSQGSSGSPVWYAYTLKGEGVEVWEPRFSYTGFRYLQVEGAVPDSEATTARGLPRIQNIEGRFLYPDAAVTGEFSCSNPDINRVHALILAAIKSNFKSVLTDCPHREKLGWLECSHLLAGCFMYNYDCTRFYEKIARDMREAQLDDGMVPDIAPEYVVFNGGFRDSPEWGSACVIAPWRAYQMNGDRRILVDQYDAMKRYVGYLGTRAKSQILSHGLGDWYDIGPRGPGESQLTSLGLTATGVYFQDIDILRRIAVMIGNDDDARAYAKLADEVRHVFNSVFFHAERNQYDRNSQTGNAMPLFLGLVSPDRQSAVLDNLVRDVRKSGNRVNAGDVGFYYVIQALLNGGRSDVLYGMLCQTNGPGYMYQLRMNATSLTEAWDTNPASSQNPAVPN